MSKEVKRTFTIQGSDLEYSGGRYKGVSPYLVAKKAAKQLFRMIENKKKQSELNKYNKFKSYKKIKLILREMTRGSNKNIYYYEAYTEMLPEPIVIKRGDVSITITKSIHVNSIEQY